MVGSPKSSVSISKSSQVSNMELYYRAVQFYLDEQPGCPALRITPFASPFQVSGAP